MASSVECKSEIIGGGCGDGWYLSGDSVRGVCWPQTMDFTFYQQQHQNLDHHQQQQIMQHQQLQQHLPSSFVPLNELDIGHQQHLHQQHLDQQHQHNLYLPGAVCSGFSSPASFQTPDVNSDCSGGGYLMTAAEPPAEGGGDAGAVPSASDSGRVRAARRRCGAEKAPVCASGRPAAPEGECGEVGESKAKTPVMVAKRNARERRRVEAVNSAFAKLRKYIPYEKRNKRLSKVKTLRITIEYIRLLQVVLDEINGGLDIELSPNYQSLLQLVQRKEISVPMDGGN